MKARMKQTLCVLLALVIAFSASAVCFAADSGCDCGTAPVVFVDGIGGSLYLEKEDGSREQVFPPDTDTIVKAVVKLLPVLPLLFFGPTTGVFERSLTKLACELFETIRCDENGDSVYNIKPGSSNAVKKENHYKEDYRYYFAYDWRLDPLENAKKLDSYIDQVRSGTGHDKVVLESYSEGGEVCLAYVGQFGGAKIEKYVTLCSAFQGLTVVGSIFTGKVNVDPNQTYYFLTSFLPTLMGENKALDGAVKFAKYSGLLSGLCFVINRLIRNDFDNFYNDFALPYFGQMPGIDDFVTQEDYAAVRERLSDPKHKNLLERVDRYHEIQANAKQILSEAVEGGMNICIVSNYGCYAMPFVGYNPYQSDALIDSAKSSGGATMAPVGKTLGPNYVQRIADGHNHVAPDGSADASTCLFPEYTWLVEGFCHWNRPDELMNWLIRYNGQPTVFTDERYPQFLIGHDQNMTAPMK
ncbi:MAG: hypothetical protein IJU96_04275 [Clostridia bacterium]|nr:hypothetical protein [Clostridia bacterium]